MAKNHFSFLAFFIILAGVLKLSVKSETKALMEQVFLLVNAELL